MPDGRISQPVQLWQADASGGGESAAPASSAPAAPADGAGAPAATPVLAAGDTGAAPAVAVAATTDSAEGKPPGEGEPAGTAGPFDGAKLKFPEGYSIPGPMMEKFSGVAKEFGITQEAAQKLVDLQAEASKAERTQSEAGWAKTQETWINEIKNDQEIGGAKFQANVEAVKKVVDQYGVPGFKEALNLTGAGNNPAVFKTFVKIAQVLTEGQAVRGAPPAQKPQGGADAIESMAARMYPSMRPQGQTS